MVQSEWKAYECRRKSFVVVVSLCFASWSGLASFLGTRKVEEDNKSRQLLILYMKKYCPTYASKHTNGKWKNGKWNSEKVGEFVVRLGGESTYYEGASEEPSKWCNCSWML